MANSNEVAVTILNQLGGNRFLAMTGAKNMVYSANALMFQLPARLAVKGINKVHVTLDPSDTYTLSFYKVKNHGLDVTTVEEVDDVYADGLANVFTAVTGLETKL